MARSRNIKPGFFENDALAEISPLGRLLFIGLWTIADKAGRLEDRPKKIKAQVLPYDDCDVEALLTNLWERGFIQCYVTSGTRYIQIANWAKHQQPHVKEPESLHPAPDENSASPVQARCKPGASTVQASDETGTCTLQKPLIPDSLNLIPEVQTARAVCGEADASPAGLDDKPANATKPKTKKAPKEPKADPSLDELLGGKTSKTWERFWKTMGVWNRDKLPAPKKLAVVWLAACNRADPREIYRGALSYRERFMPPARASDESRFMRSPLVWLEEDGWLSETVAMELENAD